MLNIIPQDPSNKYRQIGDSGSMFTSISFWPYPIMLITMIIIIISIIVAFTTGKTSDSTLADISSTTSKDTGAPIITNVE